MSISASSYYKQEWAHGVSADVVLVVRCLNSPAAEAVSTPKRAKLASSTTQPQLAATLGITSSPDDEDAHAPDLLTLTWFYAHLTMLNHSEYFVLQRCWDQARQLQPSTTGAAAGSSSSGMTGTAGLSISYARPLPVLYLTIDRAEQLPAAEAVIAAMYGVEDAITSLEQQQLVHAVVIADKARVAAAGQQALKALEAAAQSEQGLTAATLQALAELPGLLDCLLQLLPTIVQRTPCCMNTAADLAAIKAADSGGRVQQMLVTGFGGLQAAWADAENSAALLRLPLPAMQLLLSSEQLRVPSEDMVLYTAKRYVRTQMQAAERAEAMIALAPLIRAPHLSLFALASATLPADSGRQLMGSYAQKLRDLVFAKLIASAEQLATMVAGFEGAPTSWQLGARQIVQVEDGVQLQWPLPVEQLKQACRQSWFQQEEVNVSSPGSPPLGGVSWRMLLKCKHEGGGTNIGLFAGPLDVPANSYSKLTFTLTWPHKQRKITSDCFNSNSTWGLPTIFKLQPMAGGVWDEAVWATAGLPATGEVLLQLHVHSVVLGSC